MNVLVNHESLDRFRELVAELLGLAFDEDKLEVLSDVLVRRARAHGGSTQTYLAHLSQGPAQQEVRALARELTVGETYFFRNSEQFRALSEIVLPERIKARGIGQRLRFLSAACSSGEEAYSLAMVARQHSLTPGKDFTIRGVDINRAALEKAQRGRYSSWSLRELPPELVQRWFRKERSEHVLAPLLREGVSFEERNLNVDDPELFCRESYDVIFCRNALMYFTNAQAERLVRRLTDALVPGGYLFLGHAETLRGLSQDFHLRHTHGTFYYQRKGEPSLAMDRLGSVVGADFTAMPTGQTSESWTTTWLSTIQRTTSRIEALADGHARAAPLNASSPPETGSGRTALGAVLELLEHERFHAALEHLAALPEHIADAPEVQLVRAALLVHQGNLAEGETACAKLLTHDELNAGAHSLLALCRERAGRFDEAQEHYQVAAHLDPGFAMPRLHLGVLLRRRGERDAARRELGQALVLLQRETRERLILFGGGFGREALIALCRAELSAVGGAP